MKRKPYIFAMLAVGALGVSAQTNSPQSAGYEARAAAMLADGNFRGCIDQCETALQLGSNRREMLSWLSAVAAFNAGDNNCRGKLLKFVSSYPQSANIQSARLMLATLKFYDGNYKSALAEFDALNANSFNDNEREDLIYRSAYSLIKLRRYDRAAKLMEQLAGTRRYGDAAKFYMAYIAFDEGEYARALDMFGRCDKSQAPGNMADYYIAQIMFRQARYADALNLIMPLMTRKDVGEEYRDEIERIAGECFYQLHDDNRAMLYLNDYIAKYGEAAPLSTKYIVGVERYQTGDYDEALQLLAPVSELKDRMGQSASLTMGQAYLATGNVKSALMLFDKAMRLDYDRKLTELAYYNYAVAQVDGGRMPFSNSVQTLEDFLRRYPDSRYASAVREYLVKGYIATDDYAGALRSLNAMADNQSETINRARQQVNFVLGTRALEAGSAAEAAKYLQQAKRYSRYDKSMAIQTQLWLGDAYYAQGQYAKAADEYRAFISSAPRNDSNRAVAQYNLAYALFAGRNYAEAGKLFAAAVADKGAANDVKADCYNRIGDTHYYAKELMRAREAYEQAYSVDPEVGDYSLLQIAMMNGHMGNYQAKMSTLQQLIKEFPNSPHKPVAQTEIALTEVVQGNIDAATAQYKQIVAAYPATAYGRNALLQLAILSDNRGNVQAAKSFYRDVVTNYPTSAEAALAVQDMKRIYGDEGRIEELNTFLESVNGAPQLDATERNAIASASLLRKASEAQSAEAKLAAAEELLAKYPDSEGAEQALAIASQAQFDLGVAGKALDGFSLLEQRASTAMMRHVARMGVLRSAAAMTDNARVIEVSSELLKSSATSGSDMPEVKFTRAVALKARGQVNDALDLWAELAKNTSNIYGTRSAFEIASHHFETGNTAKAEAAAEKLIDANPPHAYWLARTFILYSDALRARGAEFEANEYLRVLKSNYPGSEQEIFQMINKRLSE